MAILALAATGCGPKGAPAPAPAPLPAAAPAPAPAANPVAATGAAAAPASAIPAHGHQDPAGKPLVGNHAHDGVGEHLHSAQGAPVASSVRAG